MQERGISLDGQAPVDLGAYLGQMHLGTMVTICGRAEQSCPRAWLQAQNHLLGSFADPAAFAGSEPAKLAGFRELRDQIDAKIRGWLLEQGISPDKGVVSG